MNAPFTVLDFLGRLAPEALPAFGRLLVALITGNVPKAEREARVVAETMAAKLSIKAAYAAGKKSRG